MTSLPSGLASISSRLDDTPNVRGAVDMAKRLRRAEALSALAEMDAPVIDEERPADVARAVAFGRMEWQKKSFAEVQQFYTSTGHMAASIDADLGSAIDRHAQLAVSAGYRSADRR